MGKSPIGVYSTWTNRPFDVSRRFRKAARRSNAAVPPKPSIPERGSTFSEGNGESLPRRQRAGEAQLVAVWVVDVEVALAPGCVRG
jgi:hypothetical protein